MEKNWNTLRQEIRKRKDMEQRIGNMSEGKINTFALIELAPLKISF